MHSVILLKRKNNTLHITLNYVDKNVEGIPGEKRCVVIAGIQVSQKVLEGIESIDLTVQE